MNTVPSKINVVEKTKASLTPAKPEPDNQVAVGLLKVGIDKVKESTNDKDRASRSASEGEESIMLKRGGRS